jgi:hypothetical protein
MYASYGIGCFNVFVINLNTKINIYFFYVFSLFCINKFCTTMTREKVPFVVSGEKITANAEFDMTSFMTFWFLLSLKKYVQLPMDLTLRLKDAEAD